MVCRKHNILETVYANLDCVAFAASVFLNDVFLNSTQGTPSTEQTNALYTFPSGAVKVGADNVITVVQVSEASVFTSEYPLNVDCA